MAISEGERKEIIQLQNENRKNEERLRNLQQKNRSKTYYNERKVLFEKPAQHKKQIEENKFKKRMTMFTLKRKRSLTSLRKELDKGLQLTFHPQINAVSKKLLEHKRPFHDR